MIRVVPWTDDLDRFLMVSAARDLPVIKWQVQNGIAQLWECESDKSHAYVVTRIDRDAVGDEWVIVLFEGSGLHEWVPLFVQAADERNIPLRAHLNAVRRGLLRMVSRYGFVPTEIVVRHRSSERGRQQFEQSHSHRKHDNAIDH